MADFPSLSNAVITRHGYSEQRSKVGDLVSPTDSGYKITRRKFTRRPMTFSVPYIKIDAADKVLLEAFIEEQGTVGNFNWTQPLTAVSWDVRMIDIPEFTLDGIYWRTVIKLEEV